MAACVERPWNVGTAPLEWQPSRAPFEQPFIPRASGPRPGALPRAPLGELGIRTSHFGARPNREGDFLGQRVFHAASPQRSQLPAQRPEERSVGLRDMRPVQHDASARKRQRSCTKGSELGVKLDLEIFPNFWPLLDDSRDYARLRGCRFRSRSWDGLSGKSATRKQQDSEVTTAASAGQSSSAAESAELLRARAQAAPTVYRFAERLRAGEPKLLEELDKATRIVIAEGVRSSMVATCQRLELWPPSSEPAGVQDSDCSFEDVTAPLPVIAQRLYNDDRRRHAFTPGKDGLNPMRRQAMMAIFITEFALAAGISLPSAPETYDVMLSEFNAQAAEWDAAPTPEHNFMQNNILFLRKEGQDASLAHKVMSAITACQRVSWT